MRTAAVDHRPPISRRTFLRAVGLASARHLRPLVVGFTAIADELAALMRWCAMGGEPSFAGAA